jgi:hypothetical protein
LDGRDGYGSGAEYSPVIPIVVLHKPSSLLIEHDGLICFDERPFDHRLRQSVPLQYPIIEPHQHFELCERCLPKVLAAFAPLVAVKRKSISDCQTIAIYEYTPLV